MVLHQGFLRTALLLIAGLPFAVPAAASDWPRFRGPNGTGISSDKDVPVEIGEEQNRLWKVAIPGSGNSSPIAVGGRIFLQSASPEGDKRWLFCLGLADGQILWRHAAAGTSAKTHPKNTLAGCTPVCDGKRVFVPFWDGKEIALAAYDVDGNPLWSVPVGSFSGNHGPGHSPIVVGDKVVLVKDQDGAAEIIAIEADSGHIAWRFDRTASPSCSYSTPFLLERPGETPEIVVASAAGLAGYDSKSGSERWKWIWTSNKQQLRTVGSPIYSQGMLFVAAGNGPGARQAVGVRLDHDRGSPGDTRLEWETTKLYPYVPCMLALGEHLFFVNDNGIAACAQARTGEVVWQHRLGGGNVTASPVMVDGRIYVVNENGEVHVLAAETRFREIATGKLDEGVLCSPAIADGRLLIRGREHLYCFGRK